MVRDHPVSAQCPPPKAIFSRAISQSDLPKSPNRISLGTMRTCARSKIGDAPLCRWSTKPLRGSSATDAISLQPISAIAAREGLCGGGVLDV